ncbi:phosphatidate cytidylyltransferase [Hydromonas duriensis]|uniref:Phosphatidate cytidylyltransferase n=1 Tax=Hydromonas duriensis TaxID=1527608 RepID=A0A4R6Y8F2_9BURK|nr:phosphatidate cytidylyltransferase [Hydromonas duriensis]TDR31685.1 phosphatidate cytidylyltransferase [Hydromonas duriensis]
MVKTRVLTALAMLCVVGGLMFFASPNVWLAAVSLMVAWAAAEWANLAKFNKLQKVLYVFALPALLGAGYAFSYDIPSLMGVGITLSVAFWMLIVPLWLYFSWHVTFKPALALVGALVLLVTGWCFLLVRHDARYAWMLLGLLVVVWVADTAAFFAGRAFGRRKLAPSISPGKTIEGALGAWVGVTVYLAVVTVGMHWLPIDLGFVKLLLLGFLLTYQSIIGDLFESWLKRCAGVKDSGHALPGHGGILDRIDSILSTLPLQVLLLNWIVP